MQGKLLGWFFKKRGGTWKAWKPRNYGFCSNTIHVNLSEELPRERFDSSKPSRVNLPGRMPGCTNRTLPGLLRTVLSQSTTQGTVVFTPTKMNDCPSRPLFQPLIAKPFINSQLIFGYRLGIYINVLEKKQQCVFIDFEQLPRLELIHLDREPEIKPKIKIARTVFNEMRSFIRDFIPST